MNPTSRQSGPPSEHGVVAQEALVRQLGRACVPLALVLVLTAVRIGIGTLDTLGGYVLLIGGVLAWVAMFVYALPTVLMAYGRSRPWWTGVASLLGFLPLLYGLYLAAVGGAVSLFRADTWVDGAIGALFLIAGFFFVRDYSRLALMSRAIEKAVASSPRGDGAGDGNDGEADPVGGESVPNDGEAAPAGGESVPDDEEAGRRDRSEGPTR